MEAANSELFLSGRHHSIPGVVASELFSRSQREAKVSGPRVHVCRVSSAFIDAENAGSRASDASCRMGKKTSLFASLAQPSAWEPGASLPEGKSAIQMACELLGIRDEAELAMDRRARRIGVPVTRGAQP